MISKVPFSIWDSYLRCRAKLPKIRFTNIPNKIQNSYRKRYDKQCCILNSFSQPWMGRGGDASYS